MPLAAVAGLELLTVPHWAALALVVMVVQGVLLRQSLQLLVSMEQALVVAAAVMSTIEAAMEVAARSSLK